MGLPYMASLFMPKKHSELDSSDSEEARYEIKKHLTNSA